MEDSRSCLFLHPIYTETGTSCKKTTRTCRFLHAVSYTSLHILACSLAQARNLAILLLHLTRLCMRARPCTIVMQVLQYSCILPLTKILVFLINLVCLPNEKFTRSCTCKTFGHFLPYHCKKTVRNLHLFCISCFVFLALFRNTMQETTSCTNVCMQD